MGYGPISSKQKINRLIGEKSPNAFCCSDKNLDVRLGTVRNWDVRKQQKGDI